MRLSSLSESSLSHSSSTKSLVSAARSSRLLKRLGLLGVALALPLAAHAQFTYTGGSGTNGNWSTAGNFTPSTPPVGGGNTVTLTFSGTPAILATNNDLGNPAFTLNSLTFAAGAGGYAISGATLNFAGTTPTIAVNNTTLVSITAPVTFGAATTVTGSGAINFSGGINQTVASSTTPTTNQFSANGTGGSIFNITGGTSAVDFLFISRLAGNNVTSSISGASTVVNATVQFSVGGAGTSATTISGGAVVNTGQGFVGATTNTGNGALTITGNGSRLTTTGTGADSNPTVAPTGNLVLGRDAGSNGTLTLSAGGSASVSRNLIIGNNGTGAVNVSAPGASNVGAATTTLSTTGDIVAGNLNGGVGALNVSGGGTVSARDLYAGQQSGSQGTVSVTEGSVSGRRLFVAPFAGSNGNVTVTGANSSATITDNIEVGGQSGLVGGTGVLTVSSGATVNAAGTMNIYAPGTVNVNTGTVSVGGLSTGGVSSGVLAINNGTFNTGLDNTSTVFNGAINGSGGSFNKSGTGTLSLGGVSAYTGAVNISGGAVNITGSLAPTGSVAVGNTATLTGTGSVGAITLNSGGFIQPGAAGSIGTLTGASLLWNPGGQLNFDLGANGASDLLNLTGSLTKGGTGSFVFNFNNLGVSTPSSFTLIGANTVSGFTASDFSFTGLTLASPYAAQFQVTPTAVTLNVVAVPDGSTLGLALLGLTGMAPLGLRRLRAKNG